MGDLQPSDEWLARGSHTLHAFRNRTNTRMLIEAIVGMMYGSIHDEMGSELLRTQAPNVYRSNELLILVTRWDDTSYKARPWAKVACDKDMSRICGCRRARPAIAA